VSYNGKATNGLFKESNLDFSASRLQTEV